MADIYAALDSVLSAAMPIFGIAGVMAAAAAVAAVTSLTCAKTEDDVASFRYLARGCTAGAGLSVLVGLVVAVFSEAEERAASS